MNKLLLLLTLVISVQLCLAHEFVIPIRVTDGVNADTLRFGIHAGCTDGYDVGYDRYAPPAPPAGAFDCRLRFPAIGGEDYKTDIRDNTQTAKTFYVHYAPAASAGPIVLMWDPLVLDGHATSFSIVDNITGGLYNLNMMTTNSLNTSVSAFLGNSLRIVITPPYPVPIQLASFTATSVGLQGVRLDWRTLSETDNYGFEILRRRDSESEFSALPGAFTPGHGTTIEPHDYTYTDATATPGVWWYRLRQIDLDGTQHLFDPVRVSVVTGVDEIFAPCEFRLEQNYPNPFNPSTEITFSVETLGGATLEVFDLIGQKVATLFDAVAEPGQYYKVRFEGANLSNGTYLYRLQSGKRSDVKKLVLMK